MRKILLATTFLTCGLIPTVSNADPVSIGIALSAISSYTAVTAAGAAFTWAAFGTAFATRLALGYALNALIPKPSISGVKGYSVNTLGSSQPTAVIYGESKVGGVIFFQTTTEGNSFLHSLVALCSHEIQGITTVYLNDEALTLDGSGNVTAPAKYVGKVVIKKHLGTADQTADTDLITATLGNENKWTINHRARGIAYIYARFTFDADTFPNGVPQITALVQGKKPITTSGSESFSSNSARCLADYLVFSGIATLDEIDTTLWQAAETVCDQDVSLSTGATEKRYTCNGAFTTDLAPKEIISGILGSMGGTLWYSQGKWKFKAAVFTSTVLDIDEDDLRSSLSVQTRNSRRDNFNQIEGTFRGSESNWQTTNYPTIDSTNFLIADNNQENSIELNLPFTSSSATAQRIAKIALYRNREQLSISGTFGLRCLQLTVGDLIRVTNSRLGFSNKIFEVSEWNFGLNNEMSLEVIMSLQEISSNVFDWDADETAFETNNTILLSPFNVPDIGLTITDDLRIVNEHVVNILIANTTCTFSERVDKIELEYKKSSDSEYTSLGTGLLGRFEILDLVADTYDIRARAINSLGVKGEYASVLNRVINPESNPPSDVTNFSFSVSGGALFLKWTPVPDLDLSYYQIKYNSLTSGATWDNSGVTSGIEKIARPATSASIPALSGTYLIKAYDKTGNESVNASSFVINQSLLPALGVSSTLTENPSFSGSKSNTSIYTTTDPDELRMTSFSSSGASGTYEFNSKIDLTTSRTATVSSEVVFTRHQSTTLWDAIPQNWDTWPENFDDWTDSDVGFDDNTVLVQVAATNDDPNSGSATFGNFTDANGSQIVGRGFKFKATLSNTNPNVTPSISVLKGTVGY